MPVGVMSVKNKWWLLHRLAEGPAGNADDCPERCRKAERKGGLRL